MFGKSSGCNLKARSGSGRMDRYVVPFGFACIILPGALALNPRCRILNPERFGLEFFVIFLIISRYQSNPKSSEEL